MKIIRIFVMISLFLLFCAVMIYAWEIVNKDKSMLVTSTVLGRATKLETKINQSPSIVGDISYWINQTADELKSVYGEPMRKDLSAYNYSWWVYTDEKDDYIQFGIFNNEIKTIFATGRNRSIGPVQIGDTYEFVASQISFDYVLSYQDGQSSYQFKLTDDDLATQALVKLSDDLFLQYYFDVIENKLSSIRLLTGDILLLHAPYEIEYRGTLPNQPIFSDEQWLKIEEGIEKQVFLISNVKRNLYGRETLRWEEEVAEVALLHSQDMERNQYFSHYSLNGDGLKERLANKDIFYLSAGENIAAQYPDAPAAIEGWLNSKAHRAALLEENYTHLGVGVHRLYFTQNFISN